MAVTRQQTTAAVASGALSAAFPSDVTSGTRIYVMTTSAVLTETITSISDTRGNTYTEYQDQTVGTTTQIRLEIWRASSGSSGANTVSPTFSATTGGRRMWIVEVQGQGTPTDGPTNTLDQSSAADPTPFATISPNGSYGIAFTWGANSSTGFVAWLDTNHARIWQDMSGGTTTRAAWTNIDSSTTSLAPLMDGNATETAASMTVAFYDEDAGGGGGAHSFAFVG